MPQKQVRSSCVLCGLHFAHTNAHPASYVPMSPSGVRPKKTFKSVVSTPHAKKNMKSAPVTFPPETRASWKLQSIDNAGFGD